MTESGTALPSPSPRPKRSREWIYDLLILLVLLIGLYFRAAGIFWGENQYLHPDERFLIWVGTDITPIKGCEDLGVPIGSCDSDKLMWMSVSDYFDTVNSTLNPHNAGHGYYVYGTMPVIAARYLVQEVYGHSGFNEMTNVGRVLSTIADLFTVLLVYLLGARLYDRRVGLLGAVFSALAVLQIQQSHFFTTDTFIVAFTVIAIYFASSIAVRGFTDDELALDEDGPYPGETGEPAPLSEHHSVKKFLFNPMLFLSILFGVALGLAVASKINAFPVALTLPVAFFIRWFALPKRNRERFFIPYLFYIIVGAFFSLLVFRIAQPYAFAGPGFFDVSLNPKWVANMQEAQAGAAGDIDYPFALQWGRRSITFSGKNMILWGMGIPMGLLAWAGFLWAGWRMLKRGGEWKRLLIPWFWVAIYFTWQSLAFNPTMRYQLPVYPVLAMFAGWFLVTLWDRGKELRKRANDGQAAVSESPKTTGSSHRGSASRTLQIGAVLLGILGIGLTAAWAFAFTRIYVNPITRNAASYWIYENVPGPINVRIENRDRIYNQPLYYPYGYVLSTTMPYTNHFTAQADGALSGIAIGYLLDQSGVSQMTTVRATVSGTVDGELISVSAVTRADMSNAVANRQIVVTMTEPLLMNTGESYSLTLEIVEPDRQVTLNGPLYAAVSTAQGIFNTELAYPTYAITPSQPFYTNFAAKTSGTVSEIYIPNMVEETGVGGTDIVIVSLIDPATSEELASARIESDLGPEPQEFTVLLDQDVIFEEGRIYGLQVELESAAGQVRVQGAVLANESDFDDGLPTRVGGYDGWAGIYPQGVVFQSYWDDNLEKLGRYVNVMEQADYIIMSSNRQWGSIPRVPERYPMTTIFYRELMGCPEDMDIVKCYTVAEEGMFEGRLGYKLVKVFQSNPTLGPFSINDQFAEEAFTVYDHPKVIIFQRSTDFSAEKVRDVLGMADFDHIQRLTPKSIPDRPADLMFPGNIFAQLKENGTWSELFDSDGLQNRFPALGAIVWYLFIFLLGLAVYPIVRIALPGLKDRGYPMARIFGLVLLAYLSWVIGSAKIPVTRGAIAIVFVVIASVGLFVGYVQRASLKREWRDQKKYFLIIEALFLLFFVADILIRLGNPDLWHPWKGGERPMDFAYFNAVLKSVTFPPYDPWYAGGYINYYYYGFVLVGMPTKLLGIVPSIAFNLIIPTMFSLIAMAAFSLAWNLFLGGRRVKRDANEEKPKVTGETEVETVPGEIPEFNRYQHPEARVSGISPYFVGIAGAFLMVVLGNLGTVRMILRGYQMLAAPGGVIADTSLFDRIVWTLLGFIQSVGGASLPYGIDAWYWDPSRAIPVGGVYPITEFPFFTVLYGDPHAHLFAMPVALLAIGFIVSVVAARGQWKNLGGALAGFLLAALAVGATYPLNLSDIYTYLPLLAVPLGYVLFHYTNANKVDRALPGFVRREIRPDVRSWLIRAFTAFGGVALLVVLSIYLYEPYRFYYAQGYGDLSRWTGVTTPSTYYLVHWGVFLFIFFTWFIYETYDWMVSTPLSSLRKLKPVFPLILISVFVVLTATGVLVAMDVYIAWMALPMATWAGVLILRPGQPDMKRLVLFMIGTGLLITIMVELVVVIGDIERMNTVFKFYLQVWLIYTISAAAAMGWMLTSPRKWVPAWRTIWQIGLAVLLFGAALYPLLATTAKIKDRWNQDAPHTLDGMSFMPHVTYNEAGTDVNVGEEYRMIRWLQENVQGSPVIVEANSRDLYRMYNRVSMYTGLPGVIGWENHQIQQRGVLADNRVPMRVDEVNLFYNTIDLEYAEDFLREYGVKYIIVGQLERIHNPGEGLNKFPALDGLLWKAVYEDGSTVIYEVLNR